MNAPPSDPVLASGQGALSSLVERLLAVSIPHQFVALTGLPLIEEICTELGLPAPALLAGNLVIGDIKRCEVLLTAHLDEVSFGIRRLASGGAWLAPYHQYDPPAKPQRLALVGVRGGAACVLGEGTLQLLDGGSFCATSAELLIGDRATYLPCTSISKGAIHGANALDDRCGVAITLLAMQELHRQGAPVAAVITDGEEQIAAGYFSRNFPHILPSLKDGCTICFIDDIYEDALAEAGHTHPPDNALLVPHSGYGKGYVVPPLLLAQFRDEIVPVAQAQDIGVEWCSAYAGRGDDWGLVTNPVTDTTLSGFYVSYGAWGAIRDVQHTVRVSCLSNCVRFVTLAHVI
jgi:hypothetical protein